jgi:hypothetical protein
MFWMFISCKFLFSIMTASFNFSCASLVSGLLVVAPGLTDNIDNDTGEQQALLMLVRTLLQVARSVPRVKSLQHVEMRTILAISAGLAVVRRVLVVAGRDESG